MEVSILVLNQIKIGKAAIGFQLHRGNLAPRGEIAVSAQWLFFQVHTTRQFFERKQCANLPSSLDWKPCRYLFYDIKL